MRPISNLSLTTGTVSGAARTLLAAVVALGAACTQTPTSPSSAAVSQTTASSLTSAAFSSTKQTWEDFQARGWSCRTPNNGPVTVCSPPNQPLPAVAIPPAQPPPDRPETVMLKRWRNGVFEANVLLIRPEIYNGQPCESTGLPYAFIGVLGYFECAHTVGG